MNLLKQGTTKFSCGDANFVIDISPGYNRRPSDKSAFTIVKTVECLNLYISLAAPMKPKSVLELGVFQGGSYAFIDSLLKPERMSAVEISSTPVSALAGWIDGRPGRSVHYGSKQTDAGALQRIVKSDLGGSVDLVIDDASHSYDDTRRSFEILFPLISPGGYYLIEDWAWSHQPYFQGANAPNADKRALTDLVFDLVMLHGSTTLLAEIRVFRPFVLVRKALASNEVPTDFWKLIRNREQTSQVVPGTPERKSGSWLNKN